MIPTKADPSPICSRATSLVLKGLDNRWERYQEGYKVYRQEFTKEAVHVLRVATRRLLIILEILERLFLGMKARKLRQDLSGTPLAYPIPGVK